MQKSPFYHLFVLAAWLAAATLAASSLVAEAAPMSWPSFSNKKESKKTKKNSASHADFGPPDIAPISRDEADMGVGVHREQEGVDHPYITQMSLSSSFSVLKRQSQASDAKPTDDRKADLQGEVSMFFGYLQLGIAVSYDSQATSERALVPEGTNSVLPGTLRTESDSYTVGPVVKFNFKRIDRSLLVPFVSFGVSLIDKTTSGTGIQSASRSGTEFRGGGGLNIFLSSHVALTPRIEYVVTSTKGKGSDPGDEKDTGTRALLALSIFI
jgi:hypothetical protein